MIPDRYLVIFDVDGTIYETDAVSVISTQKALEDLGLPVLDGETIKSYFGDRMDVFCGKIAPDISVEMRQKLKERIGFYEKKYIPELGKLFDGTEEMLGKLWQEGYTLAICSFAGREYIDTILNKFDIERYFKHIKSYHPSKSKDELLEELLNEVDHDSAIMIGDRFYDFNAAAVNHIPSIGVLFGYGGKEALTSDFPAGNATEVVRHVSDYFRQRDI